jgi:hypothetical protein
MADMQQVRVEIGFDGGQALSLLAERAGVEQLERSLADAREGSVVLESEDGSYTIALRKITYVKRFARESKVGFGDG